MSVNKIEEVIKSYLLSHGYQSTANIMEQEIKKQQQASSSSSSSSTSSVTNDITSLVLELCSKDMKEQIKFEDYQLFHEWVITSIDVIKHELLAVRFPIFVLRLTLFFLLSHSITHLLTRSLASSQSDLVSYS